MNWLIILVGLIFFAIKYRAASDMLDEAKKPEQTDPDNDDVNKES